MKCFQRILISGLTIAVAPMLYCAANENQNIEYGTSWTKGGKGDNEDRFDNQPAAGFFGIYDGASGSLASSLAANGIFDGELFQESKSSHDLLKLKVKIDSISKRILPLPMTKEAISNAFEQFNKNLISSFQAKLKKDKNLRKLRNSYLKAVSTATIARISDDKILLAWIGDSEAIAINKKGEIAFKTTNHNLENIEEQARIKNKLNSVKDPDAQVSIKTKMATKNTFKGYLEQLNRKIEEKHYGYWAGGAHTRHFGGHPWKNKVGVSAEPDIEELERKNYKYIVLATDGLWDVVNHKEASDLIQKVFTNDKYEYDQKDPISKLTSGTDGNSNAAKKAAEALRNLALYRYGNGQTLNSRHDDITVTVINLQPKGSTSSNNQLQNKD